jgi:hypothetical protein
MKKSNDTIGNRTHDLPACSAVRQPTAPPAACPSLVLLRMTDFGECVDRVKTHILFLLYSKPTHALLLNTLSHPHFKTLKLLKNVL